MGQIKCERLAVGYEDEIVARNINFELEAGDYLYVLGDNGSGKTTLIKTIAGLVKPLAGTVSLAEDIGENAVGYMPQQSLVQRDFPAAAGEIVLLGCLKRTGGGRFFYNRSQKEAAAANMRLMGIENIRNRPFSKLSGGQQQRVLLARALCAAEKILLLDEPTSGLDKEATREIYDYINAINKDGMTVIIVSHDMEAASKYASHVLDLSGKEAVFMTREKAFGNHGEKAFAEKGATN